MKFSYKVIQNNKIKRGHIEAATSEEAAQYLRTNGMTVIEVTSSHNQLLKVSRSLIYRVSFGDVVNFTRQLAIMLNAGLTLVNALDILKKQTTKSALIKMINQIDDDIRGGMNFSAALKKQGDVFEPLYIALIKAGEASGKLDQVLSRLADNLEKKRALIGKIKGAMIYPAILVVGMLIVMFIMITFVVPKLLAIYESFGQEKLPPITQVLIFISSIFENFWPLILLGVGALIVLGRAYMRTQKGKTFVDNLVLRLPIISRVIKIAALVDVTRTFSILIGSGVSILETITIVKETSGNNVFQAAFANVYKKVEKGESLGRALESEHVFPPILVQMATVGEESGHLDETLMRISTYFEFESEEAIKAFTTMIEPAILVVLGFGVAFIVMAVITPIYSLTESIQ